MISLESIEKTLAKILRLKKIFLNQINLYKPGKRVCLQESLDVFCVDFCIEKLVLEIG